MGATVTPRYLYACAMCDTVRALKAPLKAEDTMNCSACHHSTAAKLLSIITQEPGTTAAMPAIVSTS